MSKIEKAKPEITLDTFYRAIRTYDRPTVLYLMQHGILKEIPEDEKTAAYHQLVALQNMEIMQAIAKHESILNPEIFVNQSETSQSKVFVNQCLSKFRKQFNFQDNTVCDTLFTLSCQCGCTGMLHTLIEQKKCLNRYPELGEYPLDILKTIKSVPDETLSDDALVSLYFATATTSDCEKKLEYLDANGFDLFIKNTDGENVVNLLDARIKENRYPKNRHGSLLQIEDKKMLSKLNKILYEKTYPDETHTPSKSIIRYAIAIACIALVIVVICASSALKKNDVSGDTTTESISSDSTLDVTESDI